MFKERTTWPPVRRATSITETPIKKTLIALSLLGLLGSLPGCSINLHFSNPSVEQPQVSPYRQVRQFVLPLNAEGETFCSGVLLENGKILTAKHCVQGIKENPSRFFAGKFQIEGLIAEHPTADIALIQANTNESGVSLASKRPKTDDSVIAVGYPMGLNEQVLTEGRVQSGGFTAKHAECIGCMIITSPIAFGNSGGGIFIYEKGMWKLAGIASAVMGIGFGGIIPHLAIAVDLPTIQSFLNGA